MLGASNALSRLIIGTRWRTGAKSAEGGAPTRLRRRVGGPELGVALLERGQLADEVVVLGIRDLGCVVCVVPGAVIGDLAPQLLGSSRVAGRGLFYRRRSSMEIAGLLASSASSNLDPQATNAEPTDAEPTTVSGSSGS